MGWNAPDLYSQPEHFGLTPVTEIELSDGSYQFDILMVWAHVETRKFYVGEDSGCSCPSPFEDSTSMDDAGKPLESKQAVIDWINEHKVSKYGGDPEEIVRGIERVQTWEWPT